MGRVHREVARAQTYERIVEQEEGGLVSVAGQNKNVFWYCTMDVQVYLYYFMPDFSSRVIGSLLYSVVLFSRPQNVVVQ